MDDNSKKNGLSGVIIVPMIVIGQGPCGACAQEKAAGGPSKVATESYRTGWEGVFGAKPTVGVS